MNTPREESAHLGAIDLIPFAAFELENSGAIVRVNARWSKMCGELGPRRSERHLGRYMTTDPPQKLSQALHQALASPADELCLTVKLATNDRSPNFAKLLLVSPQPSAPLTGYLIPEELQTGHLADAQSLLTSLLGSSQSGVVLERVDGTVLHANTRFCELLQIATAASTLAGRSSREIHSHVRGLLSNPKSDGASLDRMVEELRPAAIPTMRLKNGMVLELNYLPMLSNHGKLNGHLWQYRDVTAERALHEQLVRSTNAAVMGSQAKSEFLAVMSHEIRTPLNALLGMSDLMTLTALSSEQKRYMKSIQANSEMLLALINDILDVSKIEAGQLLLEQVPFGVCEVCANVVDTLAGRAAVKGIELVVSIASNVPLRVLGDSARLSQVLLNVVGNAVKFTSSGYVKVRLGGKTLENERFLFNLDVQDTGVGIAEDTKELVFSRFTQGSKSTSRQFGGTGLGLNISRALLDIMGGTIDFESRPGQGTLFRIAVTLPVVDESSTLPDLSELQQTVIVLEESDVQRQATGETLESMGLVVKVANDLSQVCETLEAQSRSLIIADYSMVMRSPAPVSERYKRLLFKNGHRVLYCGFSQGEKAYDTTIQLQKPLRFDRLATEVLRLVSSDRHQGSEPYYSIPPKSPIDRGRGHKILVVEDNSENQVVLGRILEVSGFDAVIASSGVEGIKAFHSSAFDAVLMDIEMPNMDGFECTARLRQWERDEDKQATPIVALTAHALKGFRERCLQAGMDDYLTKPIERKQLCDTLLSWVSTRPTILVVDDFAEARLLMDRILRVSSSYRVLGADSGERALAIAKKTPVAAVVLDVDLADMKGWDAIEKLRATAQTAEVPIIAATGCDTPEVHARCQQAGCDLVMVKPTRPEAVLDNLCKLLKRKGPPSDRESKIPIAVGSDIRDLVPNFIKNRKSDIEKIYERLEADDFVQVKRMAHDMKGSGAAYGMPEVTRIGNVMEKASAAEDRELIEQLTAELASYVSRVYVLDAKCQS